MPETGYSQAAKVNRGALVQLVPDIVGVVPNIVTFQYNPEKITRGVEPWNPFDVDQTKRGAQAPTVQPYDPEETFSFTLEFDAADALEDGNPLAIATGIAGRLAALKKLTLPTKGLIGDLAALAGVFSLNLIWFSAPEGRESEFVYVRLVGILMLAGVVAGIAFLFVFHKFSEPIIARVEKFLNGLGFLPERLRKVIVSILKQLAKSLDIFRDLKEVVAVVLWTLALWLSIALPTWLVVNSFGLNFSFSQALFVLGWAATAV